MLEQSTASFVAASRYAGATWMPHTVLQRGLCLEGFSSVLNAMFGVSGSTVSIENVGLLGFTRVGSRKAVMVAAGFMIFFSVTDVLGAFVASLPLSIIAGWSLILHGYVASVGTSFLQFCNPNSHRMTGTC
uniref:nucleobase-ascorbate transporter 4-like n=1 Tax=Fragaria vesca subsp. vesca TaxID=101020 RepID=UPI0005C8FC09|nr:PREDICTED: nucleobase-ascorbate transporter 4-like [Fragaria vesca subsp. vesca]